MNAKNPSTAPYFSVVIPVYNAASTLAACLTSVLGQSFYNIEVICVNDGSSDDSLAILNVYAQSDARIRIISQANSGAACARNAGIDAARGEYIHFLDADDTLQPEAYERLARLADQHQFDVCMFLFQYYFSQSGKFLDYPCFPVLTGKERTFISSVKDEPDLILRTSVVPWNKIYRTAFLQQNHFHFIPLYCSEDRLFFFQVMLSADKVLLFNRPLVNYHINNQPSLSKEAGIDNLKANIESNCSIEGWCKGQTKEIKAIIQDILHNEMILCLRKTHPQDIDAAMLLLREHLSQLDDSEIKDQLSAFPWYGEYRYILTGKNDHSRALNERVKDFAAKIRYYLYAHQYQPVPQLLLRLMERL